MKLNELKVPVKATVKPTKRRGIGSATGQGGTAGKGHKGQKARSGGGVRRGFEGGQMPLIRRLPKKGFFNLFRTRFEIVNISDIVRKELEGEINPDVLKSAGLIKKTDRKIKILGNGQLEKALTIKAHAFSRSAKEKIENAGGTIEVM
ncbi:MAG: 50S ribosomal protein L15 [Candidatus Latescibacteria bacterium]|nr:50S ribosomal protein L15 [Candidatus Latescibacterota bacterium]